MQGILLLYGALPPAVLNYVLAEKYRQEPALVAELIGRFATPHSPVAPGAA